MTATSDLSAVFSNAAHHRGSNQIGLKQYNERLVISLIQDVGALSKAEIARITKLSAQTVTIIVNRLIDQGFLKKKEVIRGKVGQPSTPIELDPDGAVSIGIKIGRRSLDLLVLSFNRRILSRLSYTYDYPDSETVFRLIGDAVSTLTAGLSARQRSRLVGIGIAAPTGIDGWEGVIGAPKGALARWKNIDILKECEKVTGLPTTLLNDATAACLAEIEIGQSNRFQSMLYFYVGTFVGGGLVLDGKLVEGRTGNAGAVGSLPLHLTGNSSGAPAQLIEAASLHQLENLSRDADIEVRAFTEEATLKPKEQACFDRWSDGVADALAFASASGSSFFEPEAVVIDAGISRHLVRSLIERVSDKFNSYNLEGLTVPEIRMGEIGRDARAQGGALVPIHANFAADNKYLLK